MDDQVRCPPGYELPDAAEVFSLAVARETVEPYLGRGEVVSGQSPFFLVKGKNDQGVEI